MDWANERYVRVYTRDTADDQVLSWQARGLWPLLVRKADRAGVIATNHGPRGVAALVQWPREVVEPALAELLEDGRIRECHEPTGYVIPNYIEAQETPSSTNQRQRDSRERRRDAANDSVTKRDTESRNVTAPSQNVTPESRAVTPRHAESHRVTPCRAVPSRTDPELVSPTARPRREPSGPHQQAIAEFTAYFERTHAGAKPTWNGKTAKLIGAVVKAHGLHELMRRLHVLETAPPSFPPAPWDAPTFAQHFDRLAVEHAGHAETAVDVALRFARGEIQ